MMFNILIIFMCVHMLSFWKILNNHSVIDIIKNLNGHKKATSVTFYDFESLYTDILYRNLIRIINY